MGWDGMGWDGMGWDGMGWDGAGRSGADIKEALVGESCRCSHQGLQENQGVGLGSLGQLLSDRVSGLAR
jgi:hypothetical protein